jgi:catechol 2,3-dioxygenase-like lactoylglutathione lyase family enzyme
VLDTAHLVAFVATTQTDASRAFYRDVLGLRLVSERCLGRACGAQIAWFKDPDGNLLSVAQG